MDRTRRGPIEAVHRQLIEPWPEMRERLIDRRWELIALVGDLLDVGDGSGVGHGVAWRHHRALRRGAGWFG
jgi:hypothetical protein